MKLVKVKHPDAMSIEAAAEFMCAIQSYNPVKLGLATGGTPVGFYDKLVRMKEAEDISLTHVHTFNLDEYVGLHAEDVNSYHFYMKKHLFQYTNIPVQQRHLPDGKAIDLEAECERYEALIEQEGPIDLQLLGLGNNGHIGFNEPGTPFSSRTHIVNLDKSTREANARYFASLAEVPEQAITMGLQTIMEAKAIFLLVAGEEKAKPLYQLLYGDVTEDFPASILHRHPHVTVIADEKACQFIPEDLNKVVVR
ncbi:glucosamine-6-phosphate deaminase [Salsuginibacillus kocurii]|uniref:glucosamine-6-phosphate deaminase n=1 Tax=Salsuginibacillus kocurii TaxID=427078 RepID=UPI00036B0C64|nr:glucosamine-6-phosphate deaminase [Salsuginibacillus kocurii]